MPVDRALSAPIPKQIIKPDRHETQAARYYILLLLVVAFYLELTRTERMIARMSFDELYFTMTDNKKATAIDKRLCQSVTG